MSDTVDTAISGNSESTGAESTAESSSTSSLVGRDATSDDIAAVWKSLETPDAGSDSSPEPSQTPVLPDAAPTSPPVQSGSSGPDAEPGPIPFSRHKEIIEHTRSKARTEAEQQVQERYKWVDGLQPDEVLDSVRIRRWILSDPEGFEREWQAQRRAATPARPSMDPEIKAEDGTAVYSAAQMQAILEGLRREIEQKIAKDVEAKYEPVRQRVEREALERHVDTLTKAQLDEAKTWPMFDELRKDMGQRMQAQKDLDIRAAYIASLRDKGMPLMQERAKAAQAQVVAEKHEAVTMETNGRAPQPMSYRDMDTVDIVRAEFDRLSR